MPLIKTQLDPVLRGIIAEMKPAAVIPVGSIEQHGPHLPISTDSDIVSAVSKLLAEAMGLWVLPTINYGVSFEHAPFFQLSVRKSTLRTTLVDLCASLMKNDIGTVFIINGHHGNCDAIRDLDVKLKATTREMPRIHVFSYWHFLQEKFDHAGLVETSLMLAISKNVRMKLAQKGLVTEGMNKKQIETLGRLASKSFPKATGNGVWGDPTKATKKHGLDLLSQIVENMQKKCQTCLTGNGV